jgi:hypothetical protein
VNLRRQHARAVGAHVACSGCNHKWNGQNIKSQAVREQHAGITRAHPTAYAAQLPRGGQVVPPCCNIVLAQAACGKRGSPNCKRHVVARIIITYDLRYLRGTRRTTAAQTRRCSSRRGTGAAHPPCSTPRGHSLQRRCGLLTKWRHPGWSTSPPPRPAEPLTLAGSTRLHSRTRQLYC